MPAERESPDGAQGQILVAMFTVLVSVVLAVNLPINGQGAGLIQRVPNATPIALYEGMILQGSGPERYVLENHQLRPFESTETYRYFDNRYHFVVHRVTDQLLAQFRPGPPIRRLVTCRDTPYVFILEKGYRRQVVALPVGASSNRWDSVETIACSKLYTFTQGPSLR